MSRPEYKPISPPIKAVFLDFGDTLVETEPLYVERLRIAFERAGVSRTFDEMEKAFVEADWRSAAALVEREPFPQDAWQGIFAAVMAEVLNIGQNIRDVMREVTRQMTLIRPSRKLMPGSMEFLEFCRGRKIRLALLSNNDGRTREKCLEVGIEGFFGEILDSTKEGLTKPNPEFFRRALRRIELSAGEVLHVGDLLGCDVLGAQKAGLRAVWLHKRRYIARTVIRPDFSVHEFKDLQAMLGET